MRLVFLGTPAFTLPLLEACARAGELVLVVAQPDRPVGRSSQPQPPSSKLWALSRGVPVQQPEKVKQGRLAALLAEQRADLAVVAAYGRILPADALAAPRLGCVNVHASLLPLLRGAAPAQWAIASGHAETGVTLMQMDEGLDTGDILLQRSLPIGPRETAEELLQRLSALGAALLDEGLPRLVRGELPPARQDHGRATLAPLLRREDARFDWSRTARDLDCRRRGFDPWPGATAELAGRQLKLHATAPLDESTPLPPGQVVRAGPFGIDVACGQGSVLRLLELQPENRKRMPAAAFLAGHPLGPSDRFG
jgi:methionyl-tRNA formyltransferase